MPVEEDGDKAEEGANKFREACWSFGGVGGLEVDYRFEHFSFSVDKVDE